MTGRKPSANSDESLLSTRSMDKIRLLSAAGGSAGLIAIVIFLANIQTQLDQNCDTTAAVATAVVGVVSVDNELHEKQNRPLRDNLIRSLHVTRDCSK